MVSSKHLEDIDKKAEELGPDRSEYARFCMLNAKISVQVGSGADSTEFKINQAFIAYKNGAMTAEQYKKRIDMIMEV